MQDNRSGGVRGVRHTITGSLRSPVRSFCFFASALCSAIDERWLPPSPPAAWCSRSSQRPCSRALPAQARPLSGELPSDCTRPTTPCAAPAARHPAHPPLFLTPPHSYSPRCIQAGGFCDTASECCTTNDGPPNTCAPGAPQCIDTGGGSTSATARRLLLLLRRQ